MKVRNRSALVTGGGSGLGKATAHMFARLGARVAVVDMNGERAATVARDIGGEAAVADVTDEAAMLRTIENVSAAQGVPRIVVNCAGVATAGLIVGRDGPLPLGVFEQVLRVNLTGTFNVMRLAAARIQDLEPMDDGERGIIVNTASIAAYEGQIGQAAYSASKGGIVAMTLPAAREFARFGIRVNVVAPGIFLTPLLQNLPAKVQTSLAAGIPYPCRLGKPEEFADAVRFLVENSYVNGEVLRLDGAARLTPR